MRLAGAFTASSTVLAASALELRCGELSLLLGSAREAEALARNSPNPTFAADVLHRAEALYAAGSTLPACAAACADALALVEHGPAATRASIIGVSSIVPFYLGEFAEARRQLNATLDELDRVPDRTQPFFEGITYGFAVLPEGPGGALRPIWEETIMLFHRFAREPARAYTLCNLAVLERSEGNAAAARAALDDALERFRALGDQAGETLALTGLGNWARTFGDPDSALDWLERARELRRRRGDRRAVAMTEIDLALALAVGGDLDSPRLLFAELGDRFRAADDAPGQGGALIIWGIAEERAGNLDQRGGARATRRRDLGAAARRAPCGLALARSRRYVRRARKRPRRRAQSRAGRERARQGGRRPRPWHLSRAPGR